MAASSTTTTTTSNTNEEVEATLDHAGIARDAADGAVRDAVETDSDDRHSHSYANDKTRLLARLRRTEGQVRGVARMIEEDKYCIDVLTQISAITASLRSVGLLVLQDHIRGCVIDSPPEEQEARIAELNLAIERFTRSSVG